MFTHLHVHTEYSLLDGACRIEPLIVAAKEMGQTSIAITDHGVMYGAVDFYRCAKKHGIKPIIGCEVYVAQRSRFDKDKVLDKEYNHLILLCKNEIGYKNLIKMVSSAFVEGFYSKPRIDHELLKKHHEGLVCLSACLSGEIPRSLVKGDYEKAKNTALWYRDVFGNDNYFLEVQNHGIDEQMIVNDGIFRISDETGIPVVATNDVHYIHKQDSKIQQVLICIQTNHVLGEDTGFEFHSQEFYLKSEEEMLNAFPMYKEAISNTDLVAEMCGFDFEFGKTKLPFFEVPNNQNHFEYFKEKCLEGIVKRYGETPDEQYVKRLDFELDTINSMGFTDYFLIVSDFINYAKSKDIPVGPGRGSGAGSIAAYCMGITNVDPMKYQLLFERFLNPDRVSMPDFDIDFCYERRGEVIDYVVEKYGSDHVAQIVTFGTLAARAAIRDCGRAMGMAYGTVDAVAKLIPFEIGVTIDGAISKSKDLKALYDSDSAVKELIDTARSVEGMPRNASTHAAGVVITDKPVSEYVPLAKNDNTVVTQYVMTTLEELGLLKMDFLGLRTLTVIDQAQKAVQRYDKTFDIEKIPLDDDNVMKLFGRGNTDGIFQFESSGMKRMLTELKPEGIEDLIAATSLYRPGPADQIDTYISNRHKGSEIKYKTPLLKPILETTHGCMIYQEQVMQIFRNLAGYSYGRADIVRRAMSKKKIDVMERERKNFIYGIVRDDDTIECDGAIRRGVDEKVANSIFDEMFSFAKYAFNKSHAAAYAMVAYQTAYLKVYYPCEFMASLLTSVLDRSNKVAQYIGESKKLGLKLSPPDLNTSMIGFTSVGKTITYGLLGIKNLGSEFIRRIIEERVNGEYTDLFDFCKRLQGKEFNKRAVESLIRCGAMDSFKTNRRQMLVALPTITSNLESERRNNIDGQIGFMEMVSPNSSSFFDYPDVDEFPQNELLKMEKEITGLYLSGHPCDKYAQLYGKNHIVPISELITADESDFKDNQWVNVLGVITGIITKTVRNGGTMAFVTMEDIGGEVEIIVFPKTLSATQNLVQEGAIVFVQGTLSFEEDKDIKIIAQKISDGTQNPSTAVANKTSVKKRKGLFLRFPTKTDNNIIVAKNIIGDNNIGEIPLYFFYEDRKEYDKQAYNISINDVMLEKMRTEIGKENVAFIK